MVGIMYVIVNTLHTGENKGVGGGCGGDDDDDDSSSSSSSSNNNNVAFCRYHFTVIVN
jgi:hypothetical protein